jgi:uncharacterized protein
MIHIQEQHMKILQSILSRFPYTFYAFGSRVTGAHKQFSDLDLCVMEDLADQVKSELTEAFEESNLPFKVDIIEWNKISDDFRDLIKDDLCKVLTSPS